MAWGRLRSASARRRDGIGSSATECFCRRLDSTSLEAAGEALGYDRHLKSNTSKKRTHSLFRQGAMLYELIPMMPEPRLRPLVQRFGPTPVLNPGVRRRLWGHLKMRGFMRVAGSNPATPTSTWPISWTPSRQISRQKRSVRRNIGSRNHVARRVHLANSRHGGQRHRPLGQSGVGTVGTPSLSEL